MPKPLKGRGLQEIRVGGAEIDPFLSLRGLVPRATEPVPNAWGVAGLRGWLGQVAKRRPIKISAFSEVLFDRFADDEVCRVFAVDLPEPGWVDASVTFDCGLIYAVPKVSNEGRERLGWAP